MNDQQKKLIVLAGLLIGTVITIAVIIHIFQYHGAVDTQIRVQDSVSPEVPRALTLPSPVPAPEVRDPVPVDSVFVHDGIIQEAPTLTDWQLSPSSQDKLSGLRALNAVDIADYVAQGNISRIEPKHFIAGQFAMQKPVAIELGPFTVAIPLVPLDRQGGTAPQPYAVVLWMQVDPNLVSDLKQAMVNGSHPELTFVEKWPLVPFAITKGNGVTLIHAWYPRPEMKLAIGSVVLEQTLKEQVPNMPVVAPTPTAIVPTLPTTNEFPVSPTVTSLVTNAPVVAPVAGPTTNAETIVLGPSAEIPATTSIESLKIYRPGESMPAGERYTVPQLIDLAGQSFPPLTAFLRGKIDVYKVEKRTWLARPAGGTVLGLGLPGTTKIVIAIPYDSPPDIIGKSLQIAPGDNDPLELLSVTRDSTGTLVVHARNRQQLLINGHLYPNL